MFKVIIFYNYTIVFNSTLTRLLLKSFVLFVKTLKKTLIFFSFLHTIIKFYNNLNTNKWQWILWKKVINFQDLKWFKWSLSYIFTFFRSSQIYWLSKNHYNLLKKIFKFSICKWCPFYYSSNFCHKKYATNKCLRTIFLFVI